MLLAVCMYMLMSTITVHAADIAKQGSADVEVSVTYSDANQYNFSIDVGEGGAVIDGSQSIRKGIVRYVLTLDTQKTLKIVPDQGYQVESVVYERAEYSESRDLTETVKEGTVKIDIESTDTVLRVRFKKDGGTGGTGGSSNSITTGSSSRSSTNKTVKTGDENTMYIFVLLMLCSAFLIIVIGKQKKKNQMEESK